MVQVEYAKPVASLAGLNFQTTAEVKVEEGSIAEKAYKAQESITDLFGLTSERAREYPKVVWSETDAELNQKLSSTLKVINGWQFALPTVQDGCDMSVSNDDIKATSIIFDSEDEKSHVAEGKEADDYGVKQTAAIIHLSPEEVKTMSQGELANKIIHLEMHCKDYNNNGYDDITKEARAVYEESVYYDKMKNGSNEEKVFKPMYTGSDGNIFTPEHYDTAIAVYNKLKSGEDPIIETEQVNEEPEKPKEGLFWLIDEGSKLINGIQNNDAVKTVTNKIFDPFEDLKKEIDLDNDFPLQAPADNNVTDDNPDNL